MHDAQLLDIDLSAALWVLGVFAASALLLQLAARRAHTRARKRTRRAIETSDVHSPENLQKTTDSQARS